MAASYLIVRGVLDDAWRYVPLPGFELTAPPPVQWPRDDEFRLTCVDGEGRVLLDLTPFVRRPGCGTAGDHERHLVLGVLPLTPEAAGYRLLRRDVLLYEAGIASAPPQVPAPTLVLDGDDARLEWNPDAGASYAVLAEAETGHRTRLAEGLPGPSHAFSVHELPPAGALRILLEAGDGVRSGTAVAGELRRDPLPPAVHILDPAPGAELPFGQPVSLLGAWLDESGAQRSPDALRWYLDGEPAGEGTVSALPAVAPGSHRLTLAAAGPEPVEVSQELVIAEPTPDYIRWQELTGRLHST